MNASLLTPAAAALRSELADHLAKVRLATFGRVRAGWVEASERYFWDEDGQDWRLRLIEEHGARPGKTCILDLASGCGQFVLRAAQRGHFAYGLEPDRWRRDFVLRKIDALGYPQEWKTRFSEGVAEAIPFPDDSFDFVTSYQTLEHVSDPARAISEMVRVTRVGGALQIMCPDYRSFFEAHYQLPWLPLLPRSLAERYLRLLDRPAAGLAGLQYVTLPAVLDWIAAAGAGRRLEVSDEDRRSFERALRRRRLPVLPGAYSLWRAWGVLRSIAGRELTISVFVRVLEK